MLGNAVFFNACVKHSSLMFYSAGRFMHIFFFLRWCVFAFVMHLGCNIWRINIVCIAEVCGRNCDAKMLAKYGKYASFSQEAFCCDCKMAAL